MEDGFSSAKEIGQIGKVNHNFSIVNNNVSKADDNFNKANENVNKMKDK